VALASIGISLAPLAFLACPVGMGAMMWLMGRTGRRRAADDPGGAAGSPSLAVLREQRRRLDAEIAAHEARESAAGDRR